MASEHDHNEVGENLSSGLNAVNNAKNAVKQAKKLKSLKAKSEVAKKSFLKMIGGGLNPAVIYCLAGVLIFIVIIALITSGSNSSTLLNGGVDEAVQNKIKHAITPGFNQTIEDNKLFIIGEINRKYDAKATINDIVDRTSSDGTTIFTVSNDYCEIEVVFEPDVSEYVSYIDSYANGVNSTLQAFEANSEVTSITEESSNEDIKEQTSTIDEDGNVELTGYGKDLAKEFDSEFADSQSPKYYRTLNAYSSGMFSIDKNTDEWEFKNFKMGTKTRKIKSCYVRETAYVGSQLAPTGKVQKVDCNTYSYDFTEMETITTQAWFGKIIIHTRCDPTFYKLTEVQELISRLEGEELYLPRQVAEGETIYEKRKFDDHNEAYAYINNIITDYEMSYLTTMYIGGTYGAGWSGLITSNGWNYSNVVDENNIVAINAFWAYSQALKPQLCNLQYQTDSYGGCPIFEKQCTQFAATFFYDVYGFAALRGNGSEQASNLIKDCGETSACPVKFQLGGAAPGAIVSLFPNHVIVIDEVDDSGGVYISEGNLPHAKIRTHQYYAGGLAQYCREHGMTVKAVAIPIRD